MRIEELEARLGAMPGSQGGYPFGPEAHVYKVMGKMFALTAGHDSGPRVTLKADPDDVAALVDQFEAVSPGYHMNKRHWVTIVLDGDVPDDLLAGLADDSYALVVSSLPTRVREALPGD